MVSYRIILLIISIVAIQACSTTPNSLTDHQHNRTNEFPQIGKSILKRCLALSGGGIRSGATSLGVLQRLHEIGELKNFQVVSTVSGGGLPVYGLLYNMLENDETLSNLLAEGSAYINYVEENSRYLGNTYYDEAILSAFNLALLSPLRPFWSHDLVKEAAGSSIYQLGIHKTFGDRHGYGRKKFFQLNGRSLNKSQLKNNSNFPYPIFMVSAHAGSSAPEKQHKYNMDHYFELSPNWIGSMEFGFWPEYIDDLELLRAAQYSAAAADTPDNELQEEIINTKLKKFGFGLGARVTLANGEEIFVTDGGFIDNQGVTNLIRRGCEEILVLDASQDEKASFADWKVIHERAKKSDWQLNISNIPNNQSGWDLDSHIVSMYAKNKEQKTIDIHVMKLGINKLKTDSYPVTVKKYSKQNWSTFNNQFKCTGIGINQKCPFPIESTMKQCFDSEEFRAYRHLGKHLVDLRYPNHSVNSPVQYNLEKVKKPEKCKHF